MKKIYGYLHPDAENGVDGGNKENIMEPDDSVFIDQPHTINRYKNYLRENLVNNIQESRLRKFIENFETDERVLGVYDTFGLYDELKSMENQYLQLRYVLSFLPFYESLSNRTREYAESHNESQDITKALRFLYTAISGKISHLRNFRQHVLVIDLLTYLEIVQKSIERMQETDKEISIDEQKKQYENALMDKIDSAVEIISAEVIPAIQADLEEIFIRFPKLIEEILRKKEKAEVEKQKAEEDLKFAYISLVVNQLALVGNFFGAVGTAISAAIHVLWQVGENIRKISQKMRYEYMNVKKKLIDFLRERFEVYIYQLEFMAECLSGLSEAYYEVRKYIAESIEKISELIQSDNVFDYITDLIDVIRKKIDELLSPFILSYASDTEEKKNVTTADKMNKISENSIKMIDQLGKDFDAIALYEEKVRKLEAEIQQFKETLNAIMNTLIPTFIAMQATIFNALDAAQNSSAVELDVSAWKVQSVIKDVKILFHDLAEGTTVNEKIQKYMEKISESFALIIKVYDRIQSYTEQARFGGYIAGISSPNSEDITNEQIKRLVLQAKLLLQSNIVMDQYEIAVHSFKQHLFPFAQIYLSTFGLTTGLQANDTKIIVRRAAAEVSYLQDQLKLLHISIGKFDREIFGNIDFDSADSSIAKPFYTFKSREHKDDFRRLLKGDKIIVNIDIRKSFNQNAVKFNEIGIRLKLVDEKLQSKFDAVLQNFGVRMTMMGHNYYRCGKKIYYLSVDDNYVIEYSFKKHKDGKPKKYNEAYRKVSEKFFFLSPYTMWRIQLVRIFDDFPGENKKEQNKSDSFSELKNYTSASINMEIIGRGQYFRSGGVFANEVCTTEIEKYFDMDDTTLENTVERTKRAHLL